VVPEQWRKAYLLVNPAAGIMDSFSRVLAGGLAPDWSSLIVAVLGTIVLGIIGYRVFKGLESAFADVI
jgi:ABC-type polysaccharide/polyol phosphate export permease